MSERIDVQEPLAKPNPREAVGLTIILLLEVFVFMAAVFGIALSDAVSNRQTSVALTTSKIIGEERALLGHLEAVIAELASQPKAKAGDPATSDDLQRTTTAFGANLASLLRGGQAIGIDGKKVQIDPPTQPEQANRLAAANLLWTKLAPAVELTGGEKTYRLRVLAANRAMKADGAAIDGILGELSTGFDFAVAGNDRVRNWIFRLAIAMVLAMVITLFQRVSRTRRQVERYAENLEHRTAEAIESSQALASAKAGTDLIMETVDRGLFLLDRGFHIQGQYSRELERMFHMPQLEGYNFVNLLQRLLTERTFEISRDYMNLLFDKKKKERTVLRVNPLAEIEVHFPNPEGGFDSKFLNFTFRRIIEQDQVARVFVAVSDITDRVRLERQLRESEARKERQFEFLLGVLHVEPANLDDFLKTANKQVATMSDALRASDFATNAVGRMDLLRQRLDVVYRAVHTIKGLASVLELTYFEKSCDLFEGKVVQLRERSALGGDDFLSVVIAQSELRQDLDELQDLRERFVGLGRMASTIPSVRREIGATESPTQTDVVASISQFAQQLAAKLHKEIAIDADGFATDALPEELRRTVRDVLVQLTRNSLVHGVETASVRTSIGKPRAGKIQIRRLASATPGAFAFSFRDKAVAKRIITPEQAAALSDEQLVALIFRPAFSTLDEATVDGGRGIGMNVIKDAVVDRSGGNLNMSSEPGKYTEFTFVLPMATAAPAAPATNGVATLAYN
jgi:two-component system chemotaxis sensor kinase CheA